MTRCLGGLDLGRRIIKAASSDVMKEFPSIKTLSTLSPVPGFKSWLRGLVQQVNRHLVSYIYSAQVIDHVTAFGT